MTFQLYILAAIAFGPEQAPETAHLAEAPRQNDAASAYDAWLNDLIAKLNSPDYDEREWASATLKQEDDSLLMPLQEAYVSASDLEVRTRIQEIVKAITFREALRSMGGFLGITLQLTTPDDEPALPPSQNAIIVKSIVPDTAAHRAGLAKQDLILELQGETFDLEFTQKMFIDRVKSMEPGSIIELLVLRNGEPLNKTVELGVRPLSKLGPTNQLDPDHLIELDRAQKHFTEWCTEAEGRQSGK